MAKAKKTITMEMQGEAGEKEVTAAPTFQYNGKEYKVVKGGFVPINETLQKLTAADIAASPEAQKYLVDEGSTFVQEVI